MDCSLLTANTVLLPHVLSQLEPFPEKNKRDPRLKAVHLAANLTLLWGMFAAALAYSFKLLFPDLLLSCERLLLFPPLSPNKQQEKIQ